MTTPSPKTRIAVPQASSSPLAGEVSLLDVARVAGCSAATVSKVINRYAGVGEAMRTRVEAAVQSLGYRPNPALSALVRRRWQHRRVSESVIIGLLWTQGDSKGSDYFLTIREGLRQRCADLGYSLVDFHVQKYPNYAALQRQLDRAGITGIASFTGPDGYSFEIDWSRYYHCFFFGHTAYPQLNQLRYDWLKAVDAAVVRARAAGYRRIGFVTTSLMNVFEERLFLANCHLCRAESERDLGPQPKPLIFDIRTEPFWGRDFALAPAEVWKASRIWRWFVTEKPEVIIASDTQVYHVLKMCGLKFPQDVGFITLRQGDAATDQHCTCVRHPVELIGNKGAEIIHYLLQSGQCGILPAPLIMTVEGEWIAGDTFPAAALNRATR